MNTENTNILAKEPLKLMSRNEKNISLHRKKAYELFN